MSAHLVDSQVYGHLWATPEVHALFTDAGRMRAWLDILATLAEAQAEVGLVPDAAARTIRATLADLQPDPAVVGALTRETGHSTLGLIRVLETVLPPEVREWVYYGATVQDLTDTWFALTMRTVTDVVVRDLSSAREAAATLARTHRDTVMSGRTHGQVGLPITFGFKAAVWVAELDRQLERLESSRPRRELVQLGGALGSMEFWGERAPALIASFARRLGLGVPAIPWLTSRDGVAEFVSQLALVTGTMAKIGEEVYELQRPEIGELREPLAPGTVGSITMPHKRNPEVSEQVSTLAKLVRMDAALATEAVVHGHERDGRAWKTEWVVLPEACLYAGVSVSMGSRLLWGLEVDADRMRRNLDLQQGYPMSEPVMRALADRVGKHTAHRIVYAAARAGRENGVDLRAALRADPLLTGLGEEELDRLLDPRQALGSIPVFIDAVVGQASASTAGASGGPHHA